MSKIRTIREEITKLCPTYRQCAYSIYWHGNEVVVMTNDKPENRCNPSFDAELLIETLKRMKDPIPFEKMYATLVPAYEAYLKE